MSETLNATCIHRDGSPELYVGFRSSQGFRIIYGAPYIKAQTSAGGDITIECDIKLNGTSKFPGKILGDTLKDHEDRIKKLEEQVANHETRIRQLEAKAHSH